MDKTLKFTKRVSEIHNNRYTYPRAVYTRSKDYIIVTCSIHGDFNIIAAKHLRGRGCQKCNGYYRKTTEDFINESMLIHGDKYDYSLVEYKNNLTEVTIGCRSHGTFSQYPNAHLSGAICRECSIENMFSNTEDFIRKSMDLDEHKYKYDRCSYIRNDIPVELFCTTCNEYFKQTPKNHLRGKGHSKCCKYSSKGENEVGKYLDDNNIDYIKEKKFDDLGLKRFDFYLPNLNMCVEYDGIFHFEAFDFNGGEETLIKTQEYDMIKNQYCEDNNIKLLRIPYWDFDNIKSILENKL
jgi:hypothetical protein